MSCDAVFFFVVIAKRCSFAAIRQPLAIVCFQLHTLKATQGGSTLTPQNPARFLILDMKLQANKPHRVEGILHNTVHRYVLSVHILYYRMVIHITSCLWILYNQRQESRVHAAEPSGMPWEWYSHRFAVVGMCTRIVFEVI